MTFLDELKEIERRLWNGSPVPEDPTYQNQVMEQYKLYVEMADRISQRRGTANTFFLTFNTAIIGALAGFFKGVPPLIMLAFFMAAILFCVAWALLIRSYRNLNSAKFKVIGLIEKRLPSSPYWSAEWKALGEGRDYRKYIPLSVVETVVPIGFVAIYLYLAYATYVVRSTEAVSAVTGGG